MTASRRTTTPRPTRRTALVAPLGACCAGGLAGCGGGGAQDGSSGGSSGPVTVPVADVPVGGGAVVSGVVVTQPEEGNFHAFDARCPHQGCAVRDISAEAITCPCHGSTFDPSTGEVTGGPATTGLTAREATVSGDTVTVA